MDLVEGCRDISCSHIQLGGESHAQLPEELSGEIYAPNRKTTLDAASPCGCNTHGPQSELAPNYHSHTSQSAFKYANAPNVRKANASP